ncbi:MAG: glycosyltransferase family 2 protein [Bacteroidales bacterium]
MATYNGEKYIKEQLDSILCQIGEDSEVIISDDGSTDSTLDIVRAYNDERIKIIHNTGKKGFVWNFENALKNAHGDYIFLSDQDDVWLPNKVELIFPYFTHYNLIHTNAYFFIENHPQKKYNAWRNYKKGVFAAIYKPNALGCTFAFDKQVLQSALPFPRQTVSHDIWIAALCEMQFSVKHIKTPTVLYRRHTCNTSGVGRKSNKSIWFMLQYRLSLLFSLSKKYIKSSLCKK